MTPKDILIVGVKNAVLAFSRQTGEHLWATELKSGTDRYVSVIADTEKVYAHSGGELHCLDLATGTILWRDKLKGFGFGLASLCLPDGPSTSNANAKQQFNQQAAAAISHSPAPGT